MARVNVARALPCAPNAGGTAIRVYLGDALQTKTQDLLGHSDEALVLRTPRGTELRIPMALARGPAFAEDMRRMVDAAKDGRPLPKGIGRREDRKALAACHRTLTGVIEKEGNSVWAWYAVHLIGPHLLARRKIDRIVANPPWVKLSAIQTPERKRAMETLGETLGLQAGGKMAPHLDIASFFVLRARDVYMRETRHDAAAWLVKRSALHSGQWAPFRRLHAPALAQTADLEALQPFGGGDATRAAILIEHARPRRDVVESCRSAPHGEAYAQNPRAARQRPAVLDVEDAGPADPAERVAVRHPPDQTWCTLVPHVLTLIESQARAPTPGWTQIRTRPSRHAPWNTVEPQSGRPAGSLDTTHVGVPRPLRLTPRYARPARSFPSTQPAHECTSGRALSASSGARWRRYTRHTDRTAEGTPGTLIELIDHWGALSAQPLEREEAARTILQPKSGDIMRALRVRPGEGVADSSLFWMAAASEEEAGYLVALLNAVCLREAFAQSRESGRHFQLHPWRKIPIPRYNASIVAHRQLATLCTEAEVIARQVADKTLAGKPGASQEAVSRAIRAALAESRTGQTIETLARAVLPAQATPP